MSTRTKGTCKYCGKEYTKTPMVKHILSCKGRRLAIEGEMNEKQVGYFVLLIKDKIGKQYWLVVEMKDTASLRDLDQFLRDIWLECCGHLSGFDIDGERYESSSQISDGWARQKRRRSISCIETTRLLMFVKYAKRKQPQLFAWSVSMTEQGCFVTIVKKIMSVTRKCFQTYIIHPGLVSVDMKEA